MKKIYFLSSCSTCIRIIRELGIKSDESFVFQDIKSEKIMAFQLDEMAGIAGTYEDLFSKKAIKYKELDLKNKSLKESDYKKLILEEYTFLKRPVILLNDKIFVGNSKLVIDQARQELELN